MPPPTGPLIALVDDEASLRETVAFALGREGYRVAQFADGLAAWRSFEQALPDLAVLDILMPEMDGLDSAAERHGAPSSWRSRCPSWSPHSARRARMGSLAVVRRAGITAAAKAAPARTRRATR
jgi:response regulator RpfG family c-di-GMP phosphodiesterase